LHQYAKSLASPTPSKDKPQPNDQETVDNFLNFLDVYGQRVELLDTELQKLKVELVTNTEKLNVANENLRSLNAGSFSHDV
jgi:hypothetical protein